MGRKELWPGQEWLFAKSLPECWDVHRPAQWFHLQVPPRLQRWAVGFVYKRLSPDSSLSPPSGVEKNCLAIYKGSSKFIFNCYHFLLFCLQVTSARWTLMNVHLAPVWTRAPVWMEWQVLPVCVSLPLVDQLVQRSSHLALLTLVPITQSAPTHQTIGAINVTVSLGGKVRTFCSKSLYCLPICCQNFCLESLQTTTICICFSFNL